MNIEFLQANAKKNNSEIQAINEHLNQHLYSNAPNKKEFMLNTVSNGLFLATYFINGVGLLRGVGTAAGSLFYLPYPLNYFKAQKADKQVQGSLQRLALLNEQLDAQVKKLYTQWKEGSSLAKADLVQLTNSSVVDEVETNIRMELVLLPKKEDAIVDLSRNVENH